MYLCQKDFQVLRLCFNIVKAISIVSMIVDLFRCHAEKKHGREDLKCKQYTTKVTKVLLQTTAQDNNKKLGE